MCYGAFGVRKEGNDGVLSHPKFCKMFETVTFLHHFRAPSQTTTTSLKTSALVSWSTRVISNFQQLSTSNLRKTQQRCIKRTFTMEPSSNFQVRRRFLATNWQHNILHRPPKSHYECEQHHLTWKFSRWGRNYHPRRAIQVSFGEERTTMMSAWLDAEVNSKHREGKMYPEKWNKPGSEWKWRAVWVGLAAELCSAGDFLILDDYSCVTDGSEAQSVRTHTHARAHTLLGHGYPKLHRCDHLTERTWVPGCQISWR